MPLCGCFHDCFVCLMVMFVPCGFCYYQGMAVSKATAEGCCVPCLCPLLCCCIGAAVNRGRIRDSYLIEGSMCSDICIHIFCSPCGVCQEYNEAKMRTS